MSLKEWIGIITVVMSVAATFYYYKDTLQRKTKPHAFTWLVWGVLTLTAFAVQWLDGAGAGSWSTLTGGLACMGVFLLAICGYGEKDITRSDWISLIGAGLALIAWWLSNSPEVAIVLVIIMDALGAYPTFRKSWVKPFEETFSTHFISTLKAALALLALESYGFASWVYLAFLFFINGALSASIIYRRKTISTTPST